MLLPATLAIPLLASASAVTLDAGHADYAARISGGRLVSQIKDQTRGSGSTRWLAPETVVARLGASAKIRLPRNGSLRFVGPPGQTVWLIPQVQREGVLWLGWNTQEISARHVRGPVTWTLQRVTGPGRVVVYQTSAFGRPDILFSSARSRPGSRRIPLATHAHGNWAFTRAGRYRLTFRMSARAPGGRTLRDTATLRFRVG
jgi:surface-anchored protein